MLRARRGDVEGTAPPDRNDEYLLYQLLARLLAGRTARRDEPDAGAVAAFADARRGRDDQSRVREAKLHSTWAAPDADYEDAVTSFIARCARPGAVDRRSSPASRRSSGASPRSGSRTAWSQTVLKLTAPGVPDIYQGGELWDLSLVDPDNRRPVDYDARRAALEAVAGELSRDRAGTMQRLAASWQDGRIKLAIVATLLAWRREAPDLFARGGYEPVEAVGADADALGGYVRRNGADVLLVAFARFPARRKAGGLSADSALALPADLAGLGWHDLLTGRVFAPGEAIAAAELFAILPAAVLIPD